jgi:hypothetical protein
MVDERENVRPARRRFLTGRSSVWSKKVNGRDHVDAGRRCGAIARLSPTDFSPSKRYGSVR